MEIKNIIFWVLIFLIIATALWLLHGSPAESSALIAVALFVAASELLIWKNLFNIDKKNSIGFIKIKNEINKNHEELKYLINNR